MSSLRSDQKERMELEELSYSEYRRCLHDIARWNRHLGQDRPIFSLLRKIYDRGDFSSEHPLRVLELGFGSGDLLAKLDRSEMHLQLHGIDLHPWAERVARERHGENSRVSYTTGDVREFPRDQTSYDLVISTLTLHHLTDQEILNLVDWLNDRVKAWIFVDLRRHLLAYYSAKFIGPLMGACQLVRDDGPLSVLRSFRHEELQRLIGAVPEDHWQFEVRRRFPFQLVMTGRRKSR